MHFSFFIINDSTGSTEEILSLFENFTKYFCAGIAKDTHGAIDHILKVKPQLVIVNIPEDSQDTSILFKTISELNQYVETMPYFIATASSSKYSLDAIQSGFSDYLLNPLHLHELGKTLFKFEKRNSTNITKSICIKSYSDYQFVNLQDVAYLKADNNTTDIQMYNGKTVNAYKTLKHFESTLPFYFLRIHKSYIVNINHVSRIHFSKSKCYLNYNEILPFSLSYRDNIDVIVRKINI